MLQSIIKIANTVLSKIITGINIQQQEKSWSKITNDTIVSHYFFGGNLTGEGYLQFLQTQVKPVLKSMFPNSIR